MAYTSTVSDHGLHALVITDKVERRVRRFARTWSVIVVGLFGVLAATIGAPHGPDLETWERQAQLATLGLICVGFLLALKWEGLGGSVMLVASMSLGVLAALQHQPLVAFLPAAAFLVPSVAFLVAWQRTRTIGAILTLVGALAMILTGGSVAAQALYAHGYGPAHPQSALPDLPAGRVGWLWSGAVTEADAVVVARVDDANRVVLVLSGGAVGEARYAGSATADIWRFQLAGLDPGSEYTYQLEVDGRLVTSRRGKFRTFDAGPASFTVAVGSCSRLGSSGIVYETIQAAEPDLFLIPGDFFYADHIETIDQFAAAYDTTLTSPSQAALLAEVPIAYVWDDHDYGRNDADSTTPTRDIARTAFSTYVPHYPLTGTGTINQAFSIGRVRFLMLDNRSERDPKTDPDDADKTMLGADQLAWLEGQLLGGSAGHSLIVIVTSVPWIAPSEAGADHWGGYTAERQELADFIAANDVDALLMVAGDAHMVAIDDGSNTDYSTAGHGGFPLLHGAALDRPGSLKGGPYSEGAIPGGGQFAVIDVVDTGADVITIRLSGFDWTGSRLLDYTFEVSTREPSP